MNETNKAKPNSSRKVNFLIINCNSSFYEQYNKNKLITDDSCDLIVNLVKHAGYCIVSIQFLPDDRVLLGKHVGGAISSKLVDAIIVCGGTGLQLSEITLETLRPLMVKTMPGFAEIFRKLSYDRFGSPAIMARALAGITDQQKALFCLPNSLPYVEIAMTKLILPEIEKILEHTRKH